MEKTNLPIKRNETNNRFELDMALLLEEDREEFERLISNPMETLGMYKENSPIVPEGEDLFLTNIPEFLTEKLSSLRSKDMGRLIKLNGILKKVNFVTPRVKSVTYECRQCGSFITIPQVETKIEKPRKCDCGAKDDFVKSSEQKIDYQEMELEENLEEIGSRQPKKIRMLIENSLTDPHFDKYQVGHKVSVLGFVEKTPSYISGKDGDKTVIEELFRVIDITAVNGYEDDLDITKEEIEEIKRIGGGNPLQVISSSLAPDIFGLEHIKKSLALYLAKGVGKETMGKRYRENIHMLVIGDAGLAKSAMISNIQRRVINMRITDGKSASKAGIVATVSQDSGTKKWAAEAGDIVLANNGYLAIDEADKMPHADMQAIHGPMESGNVIISKAGVKVTFCANTSVLAMANPKAGMFDNNKTIIEQVDFSPTLLSRFDLIYILKDKPDTEMDLLKADQILNTHEGNSNPGLSNDFIKKYFSYVSKLKPKLTHEASMKIKEVYAHVRSLSEKNGKWAGMPITTRHLEGLIRLSEAHAKLRISPTVDLIDVEVAEGLFKHSLSDFGIDLSSGVVDLSSAATPVKSSKKAKYYQVLTILKEKAKSNNEFIKKDIFPIVQRSTGMNYGETEEIFEMLHKGGELYEVKTNHYKLIRID